MHRLAFTRMVSSRPIAPAFLRASSGMPVQSRLQPSISALSSRPQSLQQQQQLRPTHIHSLVRSNALANRSPLAVLQQKAPLRVSSIGAAALTPWRTLPTWAELHTDAGSAKPVAVPPAADTDLRTFARQILAPPAGPSGLPWNQRWQLMGAEFAMFSVASGVGHCFAKPSAELRQAMDLPELLQDVVVNGSCGNLATIACYAYLMVLYDSLPNRRPSAAPGKRRRWLAVVLIAGYCIVQSFLIDLVMYTRTFDAKSTGEEPLVALLMEDGGISTRLHVMIVGPIQEELIYRALLFGRLTRVCGVPLAAVVSSAAFGVAHWSPHSDKVWQSTKLGLVFAASYAVTGTLWAPVVLHIVHNSGLSMGHRGITPTLPKDEIWLRDQLDVVCYDLVQIIMAMRRTLRSVPYFRNKLSDSLMSVEGQPTELLLRLTDHAFDLLDTQHKGHLQVEQIAFFMTLDDNLLHRLIHQPVTDHSTRVALPSNKQVRGNATQVHTAEALIIDLMQVSDKGIKGRMEDVNNINARFANEMNSESPEVARVKAMMYSARLAALLRQSDAGLGKCDREAFRKYVVRKALQSQELAEHMLHHLFTIAANRADHPLNSVSSVMQRPSSNGAVPYRFSLLPPSPLKSK